MSGILAGLFLVSWQRHPIQISRDIQDIQIPSILTTSPCALIATPLWATVTPSRGGVQFNVLPRTQGGFILVLDEVFWSLPLLPLGDSTAVTLQVRLPSLG